MLLNQLLEVARTQTAAHRSLQRRARSTRVRPPLVLVPSVLGTRLVDGHGRGGWSSTAELYGLAPSGSQNELHPDGLLDGFTVVPRLWSYDTYGGLVRYLERVGGYVRGKSLFVLGYDWRKGVADAASQLEDLVDRVSGRNQEPVDLLGVSSGGLVARYFLSLGSAGRTGSAQRQALQQRIRRLVCVGTPQRGTFNALDVLSNGSQPAPFGRVFAPRQLAAMQIAWDLLPHPSERLFIGERGELLDWDLYDPDTWLELGILSLPKPELLARLTAARHVHETLDGGCSRDDIVVVGARQIPTVIRVSVARGRLQFPDCDPTGREPHGALLYAPGDGMTTEASLQAIAGVPAVRVHWVETKQHRSLPTLPEVHRLVVESLLAS
jgi:pimeloyl-ACP methyl ester carboxylesterase